MKKIKILPSILMLVACIAVLGVGVFAVAPTQNTISGSITINASNTPVSIELLIDGVSQGDPVDVRSGKTFDIGELAFNTAGVNTVRGVKNRKVTLKVTNLSTTQSLGVYFMNPDSTLGESGLADIDNVMLERNVYANGAEETDENKIATAYFTPYYYIGVNDGNKTIDYENGDGEFDTVEMNMNFECFQLFNESKSYDFNYQLNIEPYVSNVDESELVTTYPNIDSGEVSYDGMKTSIVTEQLIKISENVSSLGVHAFYNNASEEERVVVIPSSVRSFDTVCDPSGPDYWVMTLNGIKNLLATTINAYIANETYDCGPAIQEGVVAINSSLDGDYNAGIFSTGSSLSINQDITRIEFSSNVIKIGLVIHDCVGLTNIEIPSSITSLSAGWDAFIGCNGLNSITIRSGLDLEEECTLSTLTKTGYAFEGWYTTPDTSGTRVSSISADKYTEDVTYYTVWTAE